MSYDAADNHDYRCDCSLCLDWWVHNGPEHDGSGRYGPFSEKEIKARAKEIDVKVRRDPGPEKEYIREDDTLRHPESAA